MLKRITLALLCSAAAWAQITPPALTQSTLTSNASAANVALTLSFPFPFVPTGTLPGMLYVDSEAMTVVSASLNLQQVTVQRGARGTTPARHAAGALVFSAAPAQFIAVDKSGACDPNSPQLLNVTDQKYFTCTAGSWVSASTATASGGATAPATTLLYKGNNALNGIVAATPGVDYLAPGSGPFLATGQTGTTPTTPSAGNSSLFFPTVGGPGGVDASGNIYAMPPSSILLAPANGFYAGPATGVTAAPTFRSIVTADISSVLPGNLVKTDTASNITVNGAASLPAILIGGTWFSGGSSSTTLPQVYIKCNAGTTLDPTFNANGTGLAVNACGSSLADLLELYINGSKRFGVDISGNVAAATFTATGNISGAALAGTSLATTGNGTINSAATVLSTPDLLVGGTATTNGALVHVQNGNSSYLGLYSSSGSGIYGIAPVELTNLPAGVVGELAGFYNGMAMMGTAGTNPVFAVQVSGSGGAGYGVGNTLFNVTGNKIVTTFNNILDDGAGNSTLLTATLATSTAGTCAAGIRGRFQYTAGGAGVKDIVQVCAKDAADSYAWRPIY